MQCSSARPNSCYNLITIIDDDDLSMDGTRSVVITRQLGIDQTRPRIHSTSKYPIPIPEVGREEEEDNCDH